MSKGERRRANGGSGTKINVFGSSQASLRPHQNLSFPSPTPKSSSPASSSSRHTANSLSSSVNHPVVVGKFGSTQKAASATATVIAPSIINNHRHARNPLAPSRPYVIPAEINPENAPESKEPENIIAVRKPSSLRVYQLDKKNKQPGKYAASTNPRKNLTATSSPKDFTPAVAPLIIPHKTITPGRYIAGFPTLLKNKLLGICMRMYPTKSIDSAVRYCVPVRERSDSSPAKRAAAILFRSR